MFLSKPCYITTLTLLRHIVATGYRSFTEKTSLKQSMMLDWNNLSQKFNSTLRVKQTDPGGVGIGWGGVKHTSLLSPQSGLVHFTPPQVQIQDLVKEGVPASEAGSCRRSEVSPYWPSRALEAFGFLMVKYAFSYILETLFLSF